MSSPLRRSLSALVVSSSVLVAAAFAAEAAPPPRAPEKIVAEVCVNCHGTNLTGIPAPNLLDYFWNHGGREADVRRSITDGWPETGMPAFRGVLSEEEINGLVAYLQRQRNEFLGGRIQIPTPPAQLTISSERHAFRFETLVSGLQTPWGIAFLPDGRMLVTERVGRLRIVANGQLDPTPISGLPTIYVKQDGGLLDVAVHPDYAKNGWVYLAYVETGTAPNTSMTVVIRGRIKDHGWGDQETLFRADQKHYTPIDTSHYGCRFLFDRAGHLFFSIGDRGRQNDAQDLASPLGKIHRIFDDGRIPPDNPFVNRAGALGSIWSYGHRHPQGLQFHPGTGRFWSTEHGPTGGDEINVIDAGHNYGWPLVEGTGNDPAYVNPQAQWTPTSLASPSGLAIVDDVAYVASLRGEALWQVPLVDGRAATPIALDLGDLGRLRTVEALPDGSLWLMTSNTDGRGDPRDADDRILVLKLAA